MPTTEATIEGMIAPRTLQRDFRVRTLRCPDPRPSSAAAGTRGTEAPRGNAPWRRFRRHPSRGPRAHWRRRPGVFLSGAGGWKKQSGAETTLPAGWSGPWWDGRISFRLLGLRTGTQPQSRRAVGETRCRFAFAASGEMIGGEISPASSLATARYRKRDRRLRTRGPRRRVLRACPRSPSQLRGAGASQAEGSESETVVRLALSDEAGGHAARPSPQM